MSFHDSAQVLREILSKESCIEFVQLQINYLDWESGSVQSRLCYETCVEFGKPVIVMEPVKGGTLAQLLPEADRVLDTLDPRDSNASYALRYVMGLDNVKVILSGMSDMAHLEEVRRITLAHGSIACTGCRYCTEVCPIDMPIPEIFSFMNSGTKVGYGALVTKTKASDCLQCGRCEKACPQHLPIRRYLGNAAFRFERK